MIEWTESAQAAWTAHEEQLQVRLEDSEADAQEVAQDVRSHIEEEAHKAGLEGHRCRLAGIPVEADGRPGGIVVQKNNPRNARENKVSRSP